MYKFKLFFTALTLLSLQLMAQENSPYSRYGIGLLQSSENIGYRGLGGTSLADRSNTLINTQNPSSYATLKLTSYQLGLSGSFFTTKNADTSVQSGGFGLSYVNMAFPVGKNTGISFGLLPYSRVKYNLRAQTTIPNISDAIIDYFGGGNLQKVYIGAAHDFKGLSVGFNAAYLFGNYQNNLTQTFLTDSLDILNTNILNRTVVGGFTFDLGASYTYKIKKEKYVNIGATYSNQSRLNASSDRYWYSAIGDVGTGPYSFRADSIVGKEGKMVLPSKFGVGVQYGNGDYWKIAVDYLTSDWSNYRLFDQADSFTTASTFRLGGEFTPDVNDKFSIYKRITYRLGGYYNNEPLQLNGVQLKSQAVTVGIGYPIRRTLLSIGQINAAFEAGKRGSLNSGLVQENYTRFSIGVTLNDRWFLKRRYD